MAKKRVSARRSAADMEALYEEVRKMPAVFTKEQVAAMEQASQRDHFGVSRRIALITLTRPCESLFAEILRDRETGLAFAVAKDAVDRYVKYLESVTETVQAAQLRLGIGLCARDDMHELLEEAARENEAANADVH